MILLRGVGVAISIFVYEQTTEMIRKIFSIDMENQSNKELRVVSGCGALMGIIYIYSASTYLYYMTSR